MDYRILLKQTYRLTQNNKQFRRFLCLSFRLSWPDIKKLDAKSQAIVSSKFSSLFEKLSSLKRDNDAIQKEQLHFSYLSHPFKKINVDKDLSEDERNTFRIYSQMQFIYLCSCRKLYPKKNVGKKDFFHTHNSETNGKIPLELKNEQIRTIITAPILGGKYIHKPLF